jgi:hypothetical protein
MKDMTPLVTVVLSFFFLLVGISFALWTALTLKSPATRAPVKRSRPAVAKPRKPARRRARNGANKKRGRQPALAEVEQTPSATGNAYSNDHVRGANAVQRLSIRKTVAESELVMEEPGPLPLWGPRELEGGQSVPASSEHLPKQIPEMQTVRSEQPVHEAVAGDSDIPSAEEFTAQEKSPAESVDTDRQAANESEAGTEETPAGEDLPGRKPGRDREEDAFEKFLRAGSGDFDF